MTKENVIEIKNLSYRVEDRYILEDITLEVTPGSLLGIIGPNGGGKTTLLKIILGLITHYQGEVRVFGHRPDQLGEDRHRIGYVPQHSHIEQNFPASALDVVMMGLYGKMGLGRFPRRKDYAKAREALALVDMEEAANKQIGKLSGGQQQRVFIARALVNDPDLLILDEPTLGVDAKAMSSINDTLLELKESMGLTMIIVSHDIGIISISADSLACMNRKLYFHQRPEELDRKTLEEAYACEVEMLFHGELPHRVVERHR